MSFTDVFKKIFGTKADRDMKQLKPMLDKVLAAYSQIDKLSDDELRAKCDSLKALIKERISEDESRIAEIKAELEKDIPLDRKESLATESDKLVKKLGYLLVHFLVGELAGTYRLVSAAAVFQHKASNVDI